MSAKQLPHTVSLCKKITFLVLSVFMLITLVSCEQKTNRVYLDNWEYSLDDINYTHIEDNKELSSLEKKLTGKKGYIYVRSKFEIDPNVNLSAYGLCVARVNLASVIYLDGQTVAETGSMPPYKFSNGHRYTFILLPSEKVFQNGENELKLKIYIEGSGGLAGKSFIGEYKDASNSVTIHNFIHSTLFLLIASFMLFSGIVYLVMFFKMQHDYSMIYFSLMSLSSIFFLFPSFIGNFPWILGFMNYDWFLKIFQGCFAMITAFLATSFSSQYIGLREPKYYLSIRVAVLAVGVIYCLCIPDTVHFYEFNIITLIMIFLQVISFVPSAMIGMKMRAKIMSVMLNNGGQTSVVNPSNLPKGIPVGATINIVETAQAEGPELPPQESAAPKEETPADAPQTDVIPEQAENSESQESAEDANTKENPTDDENKETPPKVISRYGVPPPPVQKMLRERAAQFEKKAKNPIYPKFLRKSFEEKVTYFIEMSEGLREPPEFMARMMGAPVGGVAPQNAGKPPVNQPAQPKPAAPEKTEPKPQPAPAPKPQAESVMKNPVSPAVPKPAPQQPQGMGKANPPPFITKMMAAGNGQIQLPGRTTAVPLTGEMDDISMAQLKYAENTIGTIKQLITGYMPTFIAIILDILLRFILQQNNLPYITLFGWQGTIVMFLFMLMTNFAKIKKRGEYLSKNLREIVYKSTEELKQKAEELEKQNKQSQKDLEMAAQVQKTFYPANTNFYGWDIAVDFRPLSSVSGDLYDFYELEGMLRGFGIFDVSGHGISASLVTMLAKNSIFRGFRSSLSISLSEAIVRINNEVIRTKGNIENYLTGALFRVDKEDSSKIEMVNAGSPYPILKQNGKPAELLKPSEEDAKNQHGMLGMPGIDLACCTIPFTLNDNGTLVLYTDGLTEAENDAGIQYGKERLLNLISSIPDDADSNTVLEKIKEDFHAFVGNQVLDDDITVIVVKRIEEVAVIGDDEDEIPSSEEMESSDDLDYIDDELDDVEDIEELSEVEELSDEVSEVDEVEALDDDLEPEDKNGK